MKLLAALALIAFVCAVSAEKVTKEELVKRAQILEQRIEAEIPKLPEGHPVLGVILKIQERELKVLVKELETVKVPQLVPLLEIRLAFLEKLVENELDSLHPGTIRPRPTGTPGPRPTGSPRPRPTGTPGPRPTGTFSGTPPPIRTTKSA